MDVGEFIVPVPFVKQVKVLKYSVFPYRLAMSFHKENLILFFTIGVYN